MSEKNSTVHFLCLNCGNVMNERQCKVRCAFCGYFEDCSDGIMDHPNIVEGKSHA